MVVSYCYLEKYDNKVLKLHVKLQLKTLISLHTSK